jgi:hypothetical protein
MNRKVPVHFLIFFTRSLLEKNAEEFFSFQQCSAYNREREYHGPKH